MKRHAQSAVTLLELLVSVVLMAILALALSQAFRSGIDFERAQNRRQLSVTNNSAIEDKLTRLIEGAYLSEDTATDTATYFYGTAEGDAELGADRLTFTTTAPSLSLAVQSSTDDFETSHENFGPVGGISEVSLSTTAVGDAGQSAGLFERLQQPADGDEAQGGEEFTLSDRIAKIGFAFFNGVDWVTTWDSVTTTAGRLPAAVRVSYTLASDSSGAVHKFTVPLPTSDAACKLTEVEPIDRCPGVHGRMRGPSDGWTTSCENMASSLSVRSGHALCRSSIRSGKNLFITGHCS